MGLETNSNPIFTRFDETLCLSSIEDHSEVIYGPYDDGLLTNRPTGDFCRDYCLQINCDSYSEGMANGNSGACLFTFFDPDTYAVYPDIADINCYVRGEVPPPVDCSLTSNCTPQLSACGGSLPDRNFAKADLLFCIPNASSFSFESKNFFRKTHTTNDFFYNEVDKTFMND